MKTSSDKLPSVYSGRPASATLKKNKRPFEDKADDDKDVLDASDNDSVIGEKTFQRNVNRYKQGCKNRLQLQK